MIAKNRSLVKRAEGVEGEEVEEKEGPGAEHLLPGTVSLTTTMWAKGPHHYVPRKRRHLVVSRTAAGLTGGVKEERYRYYNKGIC